MDRTELKGKRVLVFGSGISGIGAVRLLEAVQADVILYDGNEKLDKEEIKKRLPEHSLCDIVLGDMPQDLPSTLDLAVMSPGVPLDIPPVEALKRAGIPVWGEVELAYRMGAGTVLAITGTNGKTTTTALLGEIMRAYAKSVFVVGNIGNAYTGAALSMTEESYTVAEISSFQLETTISFRPKVSAVLNITEDHLNRHHTMQEYIRVKEMIAGNQTKEDFCVLNYEDEELRRFAEVCPAKTVFFSSLHKLDHGIFLDGGQIILRTGTEEILVAETSGLKLLGRHNHENVMAAVAMAYCAGVPMETIRQVIQSFTAVPHRIEFVDEIDGVAYYNDSKGTNPDAAIKGIQAMNRPTLLIGGGYDKESSYEEWIRAFDGKVRYLVLIGQTKEKIEKVAHSCGFMSTILAEDLEEAVKICAEKANPGDAVLLSPACASWGQFDNYEQRGDKFKEYVRNRKE
ncbi:MAG: UDP-N-acetylmuramoyl-L-alanine--D-glutamate ligase [Blautia sp.]|jgi:UDP-N-acetylmuramoylalanine--D-glutamate ligase|uniref:UDP-N-acetylmuramoyl-L-alanine--D-glutamate ligase n=1 Tax=Blautia sp. TaxID=1955243 RepID=UPI003D8D860D